MRSIAFSLTTVLMLCMNLETCRMPCLQDVKFDCLTLDIRKRDQIRGFLQERDLS
jgi:hypothetical protein